MGSQSSFLCLTLAALTLEPAKTAHSVASSILQFSHQGSDGQTLFKFIQKVQGADGEEDKNTESGQASGWLPIETARLVDIFLLGKSNRMTRLATAHLIKSIYDSGAMAPSDLISLFITRFNGLSAAGVNSSEFLATFSYFCYRELRKEKPALTQA